MTTEDDKKQSIYLRVDRDLHIQLTKQADDEHRSLNQHCAYLLKQASDELRVKPDPMRAAGS